MLCYIVCNAIIDTNLRFVDFISSFHFMSVLWTPLCDFILKENMFHEKKCCVRVIQSTGSECMNLKTIVFFYIAILGRIWVYFT